MSQEPTVGANWSERLDRIEALLAALIQQKPAKEWYTTEEAAALLGKRPFTVREWCRLGRIHADKRPAGRGPDGEWMISAAEIDRIRNLGLLPDPHAYRHVK